MQDVFASLQRRRVDVTHAYLRAAVLPHRQREVLVLRYYSGLRVAEVAAALGITEGTVKSSAARGLDRLRALLREEG